MPTIDLTFFAAASHCDEVLDLLILRNQDLVPEGFPGAVPTVHFQTKILCFQIMLHMHHFAFGSVQS